MVGDWVKVNGYDEPKQITDINVDGTGCFYNEDDYTEYPVADWDINGIPLTEEILVKNGFMRTDFLDYGGARIGISLLYKDRSNDEEGFRVLIENRSPKIETRTTIKPVKYVHEIQHTLRDLEIDKEIIL